jgi:photosystem II stability/assembly factor-like uncharacterized protein
VSSSWELVSERPGGTVSSLVVGDAGVLALTTAAVHLSVDDGVTWSTLTAGRLAPPLNALAQYDGGLFVGGRSGVNRSRDLGRSWSPSLVGDTVICLAVAPDGPRRVLLAGTESEGMLRSEDDGDTWASANPGLFDSTVQCLAVTPSGVCLAGTHTGVYRSSNAGRSWRESNLPCGPISVECLAISDMLIAAGTDSAGIFVSRDGAKTWSPLVPLEVSAVTAAAIGLGDALVAVGAPGGVHVSSDGGHTWRFDAIGTVLSLVWLADRLLGGVSRDGILRLDPSSSEWQPSSAGLHGRLVVDLACSNHSETMLTADVEDRVDRSTDGGCTWHLTGAGPVAPTHLAVGGGTVYAATSAGLIVSDDDGHTWSVVRSGSATVAVTAAPTGVALAAFDDQQLILLEDGRQVVQLEWDSMRGRVAAVALSDISTVFVGTLGDPSVVWRSSDGGCRWSTWFVADHIENLCIAVSPNFAVDEKMLVSAGTRVYRALPRTRERRGHNIRPLWLGASLSDAVTGLAFGPTSDTVYASTTGGVQVSHDGAANFSPWSEGLPPHIPVLTLRRSSNAVFALCYGGALWRRVL